jgi:2-dehydropantoate 2-reductase
MLATLIAPRVAVRCVARPNTVAKITARGLRLSSARFGDLRAVLPAEEMLSGPVDVCLISVKAPDLTAAMERVPPSMVRDAVLVPVLNGVEHADHLRRLYPLSAVVAATIKAESTRIGPDEIEHSSPFAAITLAAPNVGTVGRSLVPRLAECLIQAGLDVTVGGSELDVLWQKLCFLAPMALLTTRARASIGEVRDADADLLRTITLEVCAVARAVGAHVQDRAILEALTTAPGAMRSSMQRDAAAGRTTELDAIGGAVLRAASVGGVATPALSAVTAELARR